MATGGSADGKIRIFETDGGREVRSFETKGGMTPALVFTGDGRHVVATHNDGTVRAWSVAEGREVYRVASGYLHTYAVSRDGRYVAFPVDEKGIGLLDTRTWKMERMLPGHPGGVSSLAFHPRGRHLVSAGGDGAIIVRPLAPGKADRKMAEGCGDGARVAFTRDGTRLVVTSLKGEEGKVLLFGVKR